MKELMVCDPPTHGATAYNEVCGPIFSHITSHLLETRSLAQLHDLFLPQFMSGEIRLHEAEKLVGEGV
jgi:hypothetical protein